MKRPAIALAISAGMVLVGSAVCLPGICGCYSWAGIPDLGTVGIIFMFLAFAGAIGIILSFCWLLATGVLRAVARAR